MSKSYFEPTFSACINCNVSSASGEDEYGTEFLYLYSPDDIMSIDVYINRLTRPGTAIKAALYARETNESNEQVVRLKRESEYYEITDEDIETWVNLTFENQYPFQFESGETFRQLYAMVCGSWDNQGDDIYLGASDVLTTRSHNSYVRHGSDLDENGEPTWYYGGQDIAITLHAGEGVNPGLVNAEQNVAEGIEMYPNPSNGIVNFTNVENATIEVYNMMGQVVASVNNANANASIDLSNVANGNYVVRIVKDGAIATSKLNIVK